MTFRPILAAVVFALLLTMPVAAENCPGCMLPEPEPSPPVSGMACSPSTHSIAGCDKVFLPLVTEVTGEVTGDVR